MSMNDKSDTKEQDSLSELEHEVLRNQGTERAFTGEYWNCKTDGVYNCRGCGKPLFSSKTKYDSGTGWPSFYEPLDEESIGTQEDRSLDRIRTEVHCSSCKGHLGHVFPDGPEPTGLRFCINSASLKLAEDESDD
ncbi:MAG: peptide-methionine (R)-S-oxide reductase MsrB [Gammaproteobacteria bacterium]|nr:peptide-methionine (R)-S-oxide reductase MsrB [Gammaproteobacteria bacterium]